jgi:hypothetical protein
VAALLLLSGCRGEASSAGTPKDAAATPPSGCAGTELSVKVPELTTARHSGDAVLAGPSTPASVRLWVADYEQPTPPPTLDPRQPAPPAGKARVLLQLVSLRGKPLTAGTTLPAPAVADAGFRSTLVVETHDAAHGQYLNVRGDSRITVMDEGWLCGTFDIGDADESARGTFAARLA